MTHVWSQRHRKDKAPVYTFSYGLSNIAVISPACPAPNGVVVVNNEFEWMCENVS
jgi:hypothetical protein